MLPKRLEKLLRAAKCPRRSFSIARKRTLCYTARFLTKTSFRLEGQMDINPVSLWHVPEFVGKFGGFMVPNETAMRTITNLEPWDSVSRDMLILLLRSLVERGIPGDMAELGVYKG